MSAVMSDQARDARTLAPVGSYMTNERQLVVILENDRSGALGEDVRSELLVPIEIGEMCAPGSPAGCWRQVTPAQDDSAQAEREWLLFF